MVKRSQHNQPRCLGGNTRGSRSRRNGLCSPYEL